MGANVARAPSRSRQPQRETGRWIGEKCCRRRRRRSRPRLRWSDALPHAVSLISTLAAGFGLALLFGFVAARLGLPALIGYLVAGIVIGPATPGFVADAEIAAQLAEIGVMLLMFGVGLHFSLDDLLAVRKVALPGAVVQMAVATALGCGAALLLGLVAGRGAGLRPRPVGGEHRRAAEGARGARRARVRRRPDRGRLAGRRGPGHGARAGVLPPLAGALGGTARRRRRRRSLGWTLARRFAEVGGLRRPDAARRPARLSLGALAGDEDRLARAVHAGVIVAAVTIAYGSALLFGVSFALGAFFAGMVLRESSFSHRAAEETLPLRDAFAVLFFVSVGMLFDPAVLFERAAAGAGGRRDHRRRQVAGGRRRSCSRFGYPLRTALTVSAGLAQIGEFSFILAALGVSLGLLSAEGAQPDRRRRADLDRPQSAAAFALSGPIGRWLGSAAALGRTARPRSRSAGRAADVDRHEVPVEAGRARRLRPGRQAHRRRARRPRAFRSSSPRRTARPSSSCAPAASPRCSATRPRPRC